MLRFTFTIIVLLLATCTHISPRDKIFLAVKHSDIETIQKLLNVYDTLANERDINGNTPLHMAVINGNLKLVNVFIQKKLNLNLMNKDGNTPLLLAVEYGYYPIIKTLLENHADITVVNDSGQNAAKMAFLMNKSEILSLLIQYGATKDSYYSSLIPTKMTGTISISSFGNLENQIAQAISSRDLPSFETLISHSNPSPKFKAVDKISRTILDLIVQEPESSSILQSYLKYDVSAIDIQDADGESALMMAIEKKNVDDIRLLILAGANVHLRDKKFRNILHYAVLTQDFPTFNIVFFNLKKYNESDIFGNTPLHYAAQIPDSIDILKILLESGAQPNMINKMGETTLHIATRTNNIEAVKLLLKFGANPNIKNQENQTAKDLTSNEGIKDLL